MAMVTEHPRHQSFFAFRAGTALRFRVPLVTASTVTGIFGRHRVEEIELTHLESGKARRVACDLVVFTADWIPDHELAVLAGAALDPGTRGPAVDPAFRTTRRGLFAAGNVLHGAETADLAALSGRSAAAAVLRYLTDEDWPTHVPVECEHPLHWIWPNAVATGASEPTTFRIRAREILGTRRVDVAQDGRMLFSGRVKRLMPGRSARLEGGWAKNVDHDGGPVVVSLG